MKSKQFNFFITRDDSQLITDFFSKFECDIILEKNDELYPLSTRICFNDVPLNVFKIYLTNSKYLSNLHILETPKGIKYVDDLRSNVIEFSLGGFYPYNSNILQRARLYIVTEYFDSRGVLIKKESDFLDWSNVVIKKFKEELLLKYSKDPNVYYSENAIRWIEEVNANKSMDGLAWIR